MKPIKVSANKNKIIVNKITRETNRVYRVGKNAHLDLILILAGGGDIKASATVRLAGEGASAKILGFIIAKGTVKVRLETLQLHDGPKTTSNLLVKSILRDGARLSYDGRIFVTKKAHLTDAYQRNENLLLSEQTQAVSQPKLEILANDVRCTHGSTTGTLSGDGLWYLESRGISRSRAEKLMTDGFLEHAISQISDTIQRDKVRRALWRNMSK